MQALLIKLLRPLAPYLAAGFVVLSGTAYIVHLHRALANATLANAALVQTNQANAAAIAAYQAQSVRWNTALDALGAATLNRDHATAEIYQHIDAQPVTADAPVAPVLSQALADIAKLQGAKP